MKKTLAIITVTAFILNLIWENAQAPLYAGYTTFGSHFLICSLGTLGDVVIILILYLLFAIAHFNLTWFKLVSKSDIVALVLLGAVIAICIEWYALATHRWSYTNAMPLLPWLNVGLLPVLQMTMLPLLTFQISKLIMKKITTMVLDKIIVTLAGLMGIAFTYWFFLMKKDRIVTASDSIDIVVEGGYNPEVIAIPLGKSTKINFIRKDPSSCLEEVVLGDFKIRKYLPLNQKVTVELTPNQPGEFGYSCGMNMYHGKIIVK